MNDGIWERNFQTGKVHRSPRFYQILGYEPEDLEPNTEAFYDLLPPGDQERCLDALRTHLETGAPFDVEGEYRIRHKSGEYIWISVNAQAEWDESGEPIRMAGSISDITERKRHQRALRTSEERFRAVIDNSPTAIFLQGLDGRFQFVNRQFRTWYGLSEDEVVGKTSDEFFPEAFAEDSKSLDREVLRAGKPLDREFRAPFIDGGEHTIIATKFPVRGSDGEIIGVGTISTDVTDQRQAEETLRHAQKMEAVGLLTGGIAHEFNNLLMIVVGNLEMLQGRLAKGDRSNDFASSAMKGALRGAELTQSLLAFSRKQTLAIVPIDLNDLIRGLRDMLGRTLGETITLDMRLARNLPKTLADSGQIEGALLNFVLNARDAMPGGGTITVGTSTKSLDTGSAAKFDASPGDYVSLEVTDTGHGMTAETIEQAFEPFFTTKNVGEGTGLGLSMVYGFAKQSNGFVELVSEAGRGTTVRLCLPRAETHDEEPITVAEDQEREEAASDRAMILVVEDDPDVRALVVRMLAGMGHDTVQAEDGRSALARLAEHPGIDLLFTDVVLPDGMSGQDIAREAKRRFPALKIVFTSGYPAGNFGDLSLDGEDPIVVAKPYRNSELAKTLTSALRA